MSSVSSDLSSPYPLPEKWSSRSGMDWPERAE